MKTVVFEVTEKESALIIDALGIARRAVENHRQALSDAGIVEYEIINLLWKKACAIADMQSELKTLAEVKI